MAPKSEGRALPTSEQTNPPRRTRRRATVARWCAYPSAGENRSRRPSAGRFSGISIAPLRILVIEDYYDTRHILEYILADMGHWVEGVPDAGVALDRLEQDGFDVLLTDTFLPDVRGWDFLDQLRAAGKLPAHVVSMSTLHIDDARGPSKAAGCCAHLVLPFKITELGQILATISAAIK